MHIVCFLITVQTLIRVFIGWEVGSNWYNFFSLSHILDADDCGVGKNPCDPETSECYDLKGAYRCICKHGYKQIPNTQKCERK